MPNASGHPTLEDVQKWTQEQKRQSDYEYIMPRDADKVTSDISRLAIMECMQMCAYANVKLDKKEIEVKAKVACEHARNQTKAISFTNYYDQFEEVAKDAYTKHYAAAQDVFEKKNHVLQSCKYDFENYGAESALARVSGDIQLVLGARR